MRIILVRIFCVGLCVWLGGCGLYDDSYKPSVLLEKKINQTRKSQIIRRGKTEVVAIATYLNNVDSRIYRDGREYFFVEIFSELEIPLRESLHFRLSGDAEFIWIREVEKSEMEGILSVYNRWGRGFLIAFDEISYQQKKDMILSLEIENVGEMEFNFSYKVYEMQL